MESLQSDKKKWKRYYAISTDWITRWLAYVEADSENAAEHPGPIDNDTIMEYMCGLRNGQSSRNQREQYYNISKHLFYFLASLYGGGPAIVQSQQWEQIEPKLTQTRRNSNNSDDDEEEEREETKSSS